MAARERRSGYVRDPAGEETWPVIDSMGDDESPDLIRPSELLAHLREERDVPHDGDEELGDTSRLPNVRRMPQGIRVDERRVGRAVAQWILHVRCECGRRWFEVEPIDSTTCPRCGVLVYIDIDARGTRR
jgi:hypothetical protein